MPRKTAGQQRLTGTAGRRRKGSIERFAEEDLRELRRFKTIAPGMKALEGAYRLTAREIDRAEHDADRYGKINATRELRAVRERLGIVVPVTGGEEADEFWSSMSTPVRDVA